MAKDYIITIDCGTTNTRTFLWDADRRMAASAKEEVGVRNTAIDGNNENLKKAVKGCLDKVALKAPEGFDSIRCIIASGMITSNVGLCEVPHISAPAGCKELAEGIHEERLPDVCPLPICFIPGVKNFAGEVTLNNFEQMDIMRGEETETMAILDQLKLEAPMLLILPGSHSKIITVDRAGRITGCLTSITGELLDGITNHTIIADAVKREFLEEKNYDREWVIAGYENAKKAGLGRACFSCRILNQFTENDADKLRSYILGAVIQSDIAAIQGSEALTYGSGTVAVVAGKAPLKTAIIDTAEREGLFSRVIDFKPDPELPMSAYGAYIIAEKRHIL